MNSRPKYKTRQKEILTEYFERVPGVHITANDVCEYFRENGTPIGQSTVYRQLENLVSEGVLNKYIIDANSPACFEFNGLKDSPECEACFHCKCERCGRLIHLHCDELKELQGHLLEEHHFKIDPLRTVIYGICEDCYEKENENNDRTHKE